MTSIRTALLALSMLALASGGSLAQGRWRDGARHEGGHGGYEGRGRADYAPRGGDGREHGRGRGAYDAPPEYLGPRDYAPLPYARGLYERGHATGYPDAPPFSSLPQSFRRGQYLPRAYWGGEIANPHSRHLRTPPPGYGWIGVGPNAYLMQRSTGLVLDSVQGAW